MVNTSKIGTRQAHALLGSVVLGGLLLLGVAGCSGGLPNDCAGLEKKMEDDVAAAAKDPSSASAKEVTDIQQKMTDMKCDVSK